MARSIDFFFFYGSTYTYLTVMRIDAVAAQAGVEVNWRPFNVRAIMIEMDNIPFRSKPVKARYMWRDIERRAQTYGLPFAGPPVYPVDPEDLANRVGIVAAGEGWCPDYTRASYRSWFLENKMLGEPDHVRQILGGLGKDADEVIARADSAEVRARYDAETDEARRRGIFGAPTFAVGDEIFWGDDRLEDAVDWATMT
ncbi:MAG: 2-hydroxychromene-2-carboxylate isomerase [Hyphomicrobiales bacterium]